VPPVCTDQVVDDAEGKASRSENVLVVAAALPETISLLGTLMMLKKNRSRLGDRTEKSPPCAIVSSRGRDCGDAVF